MIWTRLLALPYPTPSPSEEIQPWGRSQGNRILSHFPANHQAEIPSSIPYPVFQTDEIPLATAGAVVPVATAEASTSNKMFHQQSLIHSEGA